MKAGLTNQQKLYLLEIAESNDKMTISSMARNFQCSKVNSKYILDKMVEIGVLKKEKNIFLLSSLGQDLAEDYLSQEYALEHLLQESYDLSTKKTKVYARALINLPVDGFLDRVKEKSRLLDHFQDCDQVEIEDFIGCMPQGTYPIQFSFESLEEKKDLRIEDSLKDRAQLVLREGRGQVDFFYRQNSQTYKAYYKKEGQRIPLKKDSQGFHLPLRVLSSFKCLGSGLLQTCLVLDLEGPDQDLDQVLLNLTFKIYALANQ